MASETCPNCQGRLRYHNQRKTDEEMIQELTQQQRQILRLGVDALTEHQRQEYRLQLQHRREDHDMVKTVIEELNTILDTAYDCDPSTMPTTDLVFEALPLLATEARDNIIRSFRDDLTTSLEIFRRVRRTEARAQSYDRAAWLIYRYWPSGHTYHRGPEHLRNQMLHFRQSRGRIVMEAMYRILERVPQQVITRDRWMQTGLWQCHRQTSGIRRIRGVKDLVSFLLPGSL